MSQFDYDRNGNRVYEHYRSTVGAGVVFQVSTAEYDNLNRLISVSDPRRYEIKYAYDANGNRTWLRSEYSDGLGGTKSVQEYYYKYDALNRFRVTMGQLVGNTVVAGNGGDGVAIEYDEVGQRKTATYASDGHVEAYTYDALNRLETTTIDGTLRSRRSYDLGGRATGYKEFNDTGGERMSLSREFDDDDRLKKETDTVTGRGTDYFYGLDGTLASTKTFSLGNTETQQTSTYTYEWWDDAKRKSTKLDASNNQYVAWNPGFTKFWYDANGNVKGALDEVGGRTFEYMTTANGQVLRRDEMLGGTYDATLGRVRDSKQNRHHSFYHFDGKRIGNVGNDGIEREDYVQQMARSRDAEVSPDSKYRQYTPVAGADFDENYLPINASYPDIAPGRYTVRAGDTLRTVARTLWGDGAMWYLLAQANGLQIQPEAALKEFTTLTVPNVVTNFHNTSETNRVYNAAWALGDTSPSLPAPQLPPPQSSGGCGGFGQVLMIVVAVAATVLAAGAAATYLMPELVASAAAAGQGAGASVLSGAFMSASPGLSLAASAAGGAAGSVAGQAVGIATGRQQDFSWRQVAMSAVGSMVSSSIGPGAIGTNPLGMSPYQAAAARAAITSTSLQAVSMASGQQGRFNWRAVAASAVGAGLGQGAQVGFGAQAAPSALSAALGETFGEVGRGTVFGMMSGAAASAIGSGRVMARQVAVDAFGNALGNSIASSIQSKPGSTQHDRDGSNPESGGAGAPHGQYSISAGLPAQSGLRPRAAALGLRLSDDAIHDWVVDNDAAIARASNDDSVPTFLDTIRRITGISDLTHDAGDGWATVQTGGGSNSAGGGGGFPIARSGKADAAAQLISDPWGLLGPGLTGGYADVGPALARSNARQEIEGIRSRLGAGGRNVPEVGKGWVEAGRLVDDYSPGQLERFRTFENLETLRRQGIVELDANWRITSVAGGTFRVRPTQLLFSQESVSFWTTDPTGQRVDLERLGQAIKANPGSVEAVDVVINPRGQLVSADNRRPTAAVIAGAPEIEVRPHAPGELLSGKDPKRFTVALEDGSTFVPRTWEQAIAGRIYSQDLRPGGQPFRDFFRLGSDLHPRVTGVPNDHPWTQYGTTPSARRR